jgi:hypothetical protein
LVRGGSWPASRRRRSCLWETLECVQFDITAAKSRAGWKHKQRRRCGWGRTRSTKGERERKKKQMEGKVPNQRTTRGFKGGRPNPPPPPSVPGPPCQQDFHLRACVPRRNNHPQPRRLGSR